MRVPSSKYSTSAVKALTGDTLRPGIDVPGSVSLMTTNAMPFRNGQMWERLPPR